MVLNKYIELLTSPATFFRKTDRVKTYFDPWLFFIIFALFETVIQLPSVVFSLINATAEEAAIQTFGLVGSIVFLPLTPFIVSGVAHLGLLILGHGDYYKTFKPMTYALTISAPYSIAQVILGGLALAVGIPWIGNNDSAFSSAAGIIIAVPAILIGIASTVHTVYTACVGAAHTHKISKLRAFCGMYVVPTALLFVLVIIPLLLLAMALFGAAILSMPLS